MSASPDSAPKAVKVVRGWFGAPVVAGTEPGEPTWDAIARLLRDSQAIADLTADATLAALAMKFGASLVTSHRDFRGFDALKLFNPVSEG